MRTRAYMLVEPFFLKTTFRARGLLYRYRDGYSYVYGLTERGEGRLDYLRKEKELRKLLVDIRRMPLNRG